MRSLLVLLALASLMTARLSAADLTVNVEIPRLDVSEYHRPYVAIWIQTPERKVAANLAVWYQQSAGADGKGEKWLPDLRQWWRRSGRGLEMPVDGISGATRPAGKHELSFDGKGKHLSKLKPGKYTLVIEASREVGGRELVEIPFQWPAKSQATETRRGEEELGSVSLKLTP
ncbi:DUF2271 domain-containing protein [Roseiconus lacunae]|uniref:DUF2271 domain-containing protein n=1 Tax=Roseiconus lacunae TaxID=2605694 RepID=UPI0011F3DCD2